MSSYCEMWAVDKSIAIPYVEQIENNIKWSICAGIIKRGEKLPPIRNLSIELGVSVNTVRAAYKKMEERGFLITRPHHCTVVLSSEDNPTKVFTIAVKDAFHSNLKADDIKKIFERVYKEMVDDKKEKSIIFVEQDEKSIERYKEQIGKSIGVEPQGVLLKNLPKFVKEHGDELEHYDAIITTYLQFAKVREIVGLYWPLVCGMVLEMTHSLHVAIENLEPGKRVGIICQKGGSLTSVLSMVSSVRNDILVRGTFDDDKEKIQNIISDSDILCVTTNIFQSDTLKDCGLPIYEALDCINEQSMNMLKEYLGQ